jgi:hypothetical protein
LPLEGFRVWSTFSTAPTIAARVRACSREANGSLTPIVEELSNI